MASKVTASLGFGGSSRSRGWPEITNGNKIVVRYLYVRDPIFRELDDLREKGWRSARGDDHFKKLRDSADNADEATQHRFYEMNKNIGGQLADMGAFNVASSDAANVKALNLCMAPGGYTWSLLESNPSARISGITLPLELGGHRMRLPYGDEDPRVQVEFMDITLMASEFGTPISDIPQEHPEAASFHSQAPYQDIIYDIVLCDGQVLRNHKRAEYRQNREGARLTLAQLIFGMKRIKTGGTFILLLHKADAWDNIELLRTFSLFSTIQLFKPTKIHAARSSFYLVAKNVQPEHPEVVKVIEQWQKQWWKTTFAGKDGTGEEIEEDDQMIKSLLDSFGQELIELGRPIWRVQLEALKRADYMR